MEQDSNKIVSSDNESLILVDTEDKEIGVNAFLNRESPEWLGK